MTHPSSSSTLEPTKKRVRVRTPDNRDASAKSSAAPRSASNLAHDSLGWSLALSARVLAKVRQGQSLTLAQEILAGEAQVARAAAQDVIYGVLRHYGQGEFILSRLMNKPLTHIETYTLLLSALYRLKTRPESAPMVVDQSVAAAGEISGNVFKGVVNGVLRNFLRQRDALLLAMSADEEASLAFPAWWIKRMKRFYPENWREITAACNTPPPMTLRVNRRKSDVADYQGALTNNGLSARLVGEHGLILQKPVLVQSLPGFSEGLVSVQDMAAQRAATLLAPVDGEYVLDACAAPGGKSAHLLEMADIDLVAIDVDAFRTKRIDENLERLGLKAEVKVADCAQTELWWDGKPFDAILADVPCSASGVVRRHPDIKLLRRESDILRFAKKQSAILDALWSLLKPGGRLLYATCSIFPEENAGQIDAFLVRQPDAARLVEEKWLPQEDHDGFYYALLRKNFPVVGE